MAAPIVHLNPLPISSASSTKSSKNSNSFFSEYGSYVSAGLGILSGYAKYQSNKSLLNAQARVYNQNAENALYEGRENVKKVFLSGEQAQGSLLADAGASGVDVNNSQTVSSAQRVLQKGINDDVFSTMYSAATEANQQSINAQMAKYQIKQAKKSFILNSATSLLGAFL